MLIKHHRESNKLALICLVVFVVGIGSTGLGWDRHDIITEESLSSVSLKHEVATYVSLTEALRKARYPGGVPALLAELKLHKSWQFRPKLAEVVGAVIPVRKILSKYADEPDWGGDQNLFEEGQYPELWTEDTPYVAQRTGLGSQGFRHMYFPGKLRWREPIASFQVPMRALGVAPERAELYFQLGHRLLEQGQTYWAYRFLAWSLHYVQDLHQPYHVRQTPLKSFIKWKLKYGIVPTLDIPKSADTVAYYHTSFETWLKKQTEDRVPVLLGALRTRKRNEITPPLTSFIKNTVVTNAEKRAYRLGILSKSFYPMPIYGQEKSPADFVGESSWWSGIKDKKQAKVVLELTAELFEQTAATTRSLVEGFTSASLWKKGGTLRR